MTTLLIRLVRLDYKILGGFLLVEHSCDYPIDPAWTQLLQPTWGLFVQWTRVFRTLVIGLEVRLGSQVYSPKNPGYPAFLSLPLRPDWLEWLAVLLTVNLIQTLNLSKLKRRLVMWGLAYKVEWRINSVPVRPFESTWLEGLAACESLVFVFRFIFDLNIFWGSSFVTC